MKYAVTTCLQVQTSDSGRTGAVNAGVTCSLLVAPNYFDVNQAFWQLATKLFAGIAQLQTNGSNALGHLVVHSGQIVFGHLDVIICSSGIVQSACLSLRLNVNWCNEVCKMTNPISSTTMLRQLGHCGTSSLQFQTQTIDHTAGGVILIQGMRQFLASGLNLLAQREAVQHASIPFVLQSLQQQGNRGGGERTQRSTSRVVEFQSNELNSENHKLDLENSRAHLFGSQVFAIDGIAAILFNVLQKQTSLEDLARCRWYNGLFSGNTRDCANKCRHPSKLKIEDKWKRNSFSTTQRTPLWTQCHS